MYQSHARQALLHQYPDHYGVVLKLLLQGFVCCICSVLTHNNRFTRGRKGKCRRLATSQRHHIVCRYVWLCTWSYIPPLSCLQWLCVVVRVCLICCNLLHFSSCMSVCVLWLIVVPICFSLSKSFYCSSLL